MNHDIYKYKNYRLPIFIYEIVIYQLIYLFCTVVITILGFTYDWYYKVVVNMAHTELFVSC